ncbi:hypothetical protein [Paraburkholderia sp. BL25I1N1]|uniref:hypothetical protein n=1 Tax=Paraburkholderia sp. BL25I1N1 TaxID=1938804 RepID=UPI000D41746D|nr:hypothetical protein [Paraburkholderia sp. BL25I1N1]PRY05603.1 hypothetical protein B0G73_109200 [Paraburkholderia sp. BL25I1N1]
MKVIVLYETAMCGAPTLFQNATIQLPTHGVLCRNRLVGELYTAVEVWFITVMRVKLEIFFLSRRLFGKIVIFAPAKVAVWNKD